MHTTDEQSRLDDKFLGAAIRSKHQRDNVIYIVDCIFYVESKSKWLAHCYNVKRPDDNVNWDVNSLKIVKVQQTLNW